MGAEQSTPVAETPFPAAWAKKAAVSNPLPAICGISKLKMKDFLAVQAQTAELERPAWKFESFLPHAACALKIDNQLTKMVDGMVPKRVAEDEFWRLYFCHVFAAVTGTPAVQAPVTGTPAVQAAHEVDPKMRSELSGLSLAELKKRAREAGILGEEDPKKASGTAAANSKVTKSLLQAADDRTSTAIIEAFTTNQTFMAFAQQETSAILQRDTEDDEKLAEGIAMAVRKGVVPANPKVEPVCSIDVLGRSADAVANMIIEKLGDAAKDGCVLVLQGLSGTGKGTTVAKLQASLPRATSWSNGNVFRSLTLLALAHCDQQGVEFSDYILTPELLQELMGCLSFEKLEGDGKFDIKVCVNGEVLYVSEIKNTKLMDKRVAKNIPTVAKVTQGEVIKFAAAAADQMRSHGMNVLMEGRAQTLNYVRTPHRFELTLSEPNIIGMRRAAQRMSAAALEKLRGTDEPSAEEVYAALLLELTAMAGGALPASAASPQKGLSKALLEAGDDSTSNAIIDAFKSSALFLDFSTKETEAILKRDQEDDDKLAEGIKMAAAKGVVPANPAVEPICVIDVMGLSADEVAGKIVDRLGDAPKKGCVLILQGLSGTGKGTTVSKLQELLPNAKSWSNGNVFRSLTLLAVSYCEQKGQAFTADVLTPELLQEFMACLKFAKFDDSFDIEINGFGQKGLVSQVANTLLKEPRVGKNIPTVAKVTQGEVIKFAAAAAETMRAHGTNVLMEGRAQTLAYVRTPHRFELTLSDPNIIGMRRAAQRMMGRALERLQGIAAPSQTEVHDVLHTELAAMSLSKALLQKGDDTTSSTIVAAFSSDPTFQAFSKKETEAILQRDKEDDDKLAAGIKMAVEKKVIPANPAVEALCCIDVMGMSADDVAAKIVDRLGDAPSRGCVLVLQGLSGTGKGTTVSKLQAILPNATCWSNGNVFRSLTLLAVSYCEQLGQEFAAYVLTPELLEEFMACLTFEKADGKYDIRIKGYGHDVLVSQVANTLLKEPRVGKNIPTVAKVTQGEVIKFAAAAADTMRADGMNVLMEGRAQTLDYVRTPHRFELTLSDPNIIGMRRAAQRMMAQALERLDASAEPAAEEVQKALLAELAQMGGAASSPFT